MSRTNPAYVNRYMPRAEYLLYGARATCLRGNDLPQAKLDADKVKRIRSNAERWTANRWAKEYGVHYRTIEKVRQFESWGHV